MIPSNRRNSGVDVLESSQTADTAMHEISTKEEILHGIRDGYAFVMSGGKGQPVDDVHREIAEEVAREEHAQNADSSR